MAHDVFISYASHDKVIANAACAILESRGVRCWMAPRDVLAGTSYGESIIDGITGARVMVLVLSSAANSSHHIYKEVERAVHNGVTIVPFRIEDVTPAKSLDYFLASVHWLDALTPPLEAHLESLANTVNRLLPERPTPPRVEPSRPAGIEARPAPASAGRSPLAGRTGLAVIAGGLVIVALAVFALCPRDDAPEDGSFGPDRSLTVLPPTDRPPPPGESAIVGCWQWFNGVTVQVNRDGSVQGGPFTGRWGAGAGPFGYTMTWPVPVDRIVLSRDGGSLAGSNQYGIQVTATRLTPSSASPVGTWKWFNGAVVQIDPGGAAHAGPIIGRWADSGGGFTITWPEPMNVLTLTADGQRLSGSDQFGNQISGTRLPTCGAA